MAYNALVAPVRVRPHPNSDNGLKLLNISGYQVITAADVADGDLMVFFEAGGVLAPEYLKSNNEYRSKYGLNDNQSDAAYGWRIEEDRLAIPGGFFESSGRVRTIRMRGENSEGYAIKPELLAHTFGVDVNSFFAGQTFNELNGHKVCWKYVSAATKRAQAKAKKANQRTFGLDMFHKHFDTDKLRHGISSIPDGARVIITEKLHGTSGRTGRVLVDRPSSWLTKLLTKIGFATTPTQYWDVVTGTRKIVRFIGERDDVRPDLVGEDSKVRHEVHQTLTPCLKKGETIYYEIVGHWETGAPIFKHGVPTDGIGNKIWKQFKSQIPEHWGRAFHYNYGTTGNQYQIYVYRITQTNVDGWTVDLSWEQVQTRCNDLGLETVPELNQGIVNWTTDGPSGAGGLAYKSYSGKIYNTLLTDIAGDLGNGSSTLDPRHVSEGVCVRVEHPDFRKTFKYKSFNFCHLEGIRKNSDDYVDAEEIG